MTAVTYWLPHLADLPMVPLPGAAGEAGLAGPRLTPAQTSALADHLRLARTDGLERRTTAQILAVLDQVAARWQDPAYPLRRTALAWLPRITGYAPAMVEEGLSLQTRRASGRALRQLLRAELPDPRALDAFVPHPGGRGLTRAYGASLCGFVFSGNVPGIPAFHLAVALLARSACLAKTAAGEPLFAALWCRTLAEVDPQLGQCMAAFHWPGEESRLHGQAFATAGAVVAFGSDRSLQDLAGALPPGPRLIPYGSRLSLACVAQEALAPGEAAMRRIAAAAARDVAMFDQQGCVSPHIILAEGDAAPFAGALAGALAQLEQRWPRAPLDPEAAAAIQVARGAWRFAPGCRVWASQGSTAWTVVLTPTAASLQPGPLNRFVFVHPVASLDQVAGLVTDWDGYLQTCGYAGPPARGRLLAAALAPLGLSRLCPLGLAQEPAPHWRHDGRPVLLPLLHWVDIEEEEETAP